MGESIKAVLSLIVIIAFFASWFAWSDEGKRSFHENVWNVRVGIGAAGAISLFLLLWAQYRRDKLPDMLARISRQHFNCDGLLLVVLPECLDGMCFISVYFQNRYERPCTAHLVIRPATPHLGIRRPKDLATIDLEIECDGAAYGVARVPFAVPHARQGTKVRFDVGGKNHYPNGRGKLLRYKEGVHIRPPANLADAVVNLASAVTGHLHRSKDASFKLQFPSMCLR